MSKTCLMEPIFVQELLFRRRHSYFMLFSRSVYLAVSHLLLTFPHEHIPLPCPHPTPDSRDQLISLNKEGSCGDSLWIYSGQCWKQRKVEEVFLKEVPPPTNLVNEADPLFTVKFLLKCLPSECSGAL